MTDVPAFVDPETHGALRPASAAELTELTRRLEAGELRRRDGGGLPSRLDGAYVPEAGSYAYPVVEDVPDFLVDERIEWNGSLLGGKG